MDARVKIVAFTRELTDTALELYAGRPDKSWSLTDCLSFVVMGHQGITDALATDHHFEQAGFKPIMLGELETDTLKADLNQ